MPVNAGSDVLINEGRIYNFYICKSDRNRTEFLENLMGTVRHLGHASFSMRLLNLSSHGGQSTNLFLLQA